MKYKADPYIQKLVNKQVPFKFHGEKLKFDLSLALFSSFDIDAGSKLLLKSLAKNIPLEKVEKAVDTGCGTGVLGICLKKKFPEMDIFFQDRDALAVAFTKHNASVNGIKLSDDKLACGLLLDGVKADSQDLIVCNIPAKAGDRVIKDFIKKSSSCIKADGRVAVVIVDTLKQLCAKTIKDNGLELLHSDSTKMHTVYHFGKNPKDFDIPFKRYIRHKGPFQMGDDEAYELSTVYNLPDFDQLSFTLHVSAELLRHEGFSGHALFWNPGQGHLPVWLNSRGSNNFKSIRLASRDYLQCKISYHNLMDAGFDGKVKSRNLADESLLTEEYGEDSFDCVFITLNPVPKVKWHQDLADTVNKLTRKGKFCFIMGRSSDMSQLEKHIYGFKTIQDDRFKGNRGLLLKRVQKSSAKG